MPTLAWVEREYEVALQSANTPSNLRDFALLCIALDHLRASTPDSEPKSEQKSEQKKRDAILLTAHSADLDKIPTITQIEDAIGAISINTPEEKKRVQDARTWAGIIGKK